MCEVLEVSPSGYFSWSAAERRPAGGPRRGHSDEALLAHIRAIHEQLRAGYGRPPFILSATTGPFPQTDQIAASRDPSLLVSRHCRAGVDMSGEALIAFDPFTYHPVQLRRLSA